MCSPSVRLPLHNIAVADDWAMTIRPWTFGQLHYNPGHLGNDIIARDIWAMTIRPRTFEQ